MKQVSVFALLLFTSVLGVVTASQAGETLQLLEDTDDLSAPYKQWWYATPSDLPAAGEGTHEVFIRGNGKRGDFFGVLYVDCRNAAYSEWLATGGFLSAEDVPARAIVALREALCISG
ncbi:hypothetical protein ACN2XU_02980 [Primorskyibacter sp. 2E107]|uniref:hypothetical protein n=1 Tax=Primorskyibacter sp. 2E107 TaxID=3403458 RepID=UPI003AF8437B